MKILGRRAARAEAFSGAGTCQGGDTSCNMTKADLQDAAENPY